MRRCEVDGTKMVRSGNVTLSPVHMIILVKMEAELTGAAEGWVMKLEILIRPLLQWVVRLQMNA